MPDTTQQNRMILGLIMGGVLLWGLYLSVGAYLAASKQNFDPLRALIVMACVSGFLGFWAMMLLIRGWRRSRHKEEAHRH